MSHLSLAQQRLLDAAADVFAEKGFGGTSTRDIAARMGRSSAAVYIHYGTKEELLYAISFQGHQEALAVLREARDAVEDPAAQLWAMVHRFSQWHMVHARRARVVQYEFGALAEEHRAEIRDLRREMSRLTVEVLGDGVASGAFVIADLEGTARAVLSLCIDLVRWFDPGLARNQERVAVLNADLAMRMVASPRTSLEG
jgi:AcrR family transcriptional regulator